MFIISTIYDFHRHTNRTTLKYEPRLQNGTMQIRRQPNDYLFIYVNALYICDERALDAINWRLVKYKSNTHFQIDTDTHLFV